MRQPDIMSDIVDVGIRGGAGSLYVLKCGGEMVLTALIGLIGGAGSLVYATKASQYFGYKLREDIYKKVQSFSFANIDKFSTASLVTRTTNDVVTMQNLLGQALRMLVRTPMTFFGGLIYACMINLKLALVFLVAIPLILLVISINVKKTFPLFSKVQDKLDKMNAVIQENLTGIRVCQGLQPCRI